MNILILGGDLAGVYAIHWIRKIDPSSQITLICDTDFPGYLRSLLPGIVVDEIKPSFSVIFPKSFLEYVERVEIKKVKNLANTIAKNGKLIVAGEEYDLEYWDKILISTGVKALKVPRKLADKNREIYPLEKVEEALRLAERIQELDKHEKIGIIGGFQGLDIAYKLACANFDIELFFDYKHGQVLDEDMFKILKKIIPSNLVFKEMDWSKVANNRILVIRGYTRPLVPGIEGLPIGKVGGIMVDNYMKATKNVFAAGTVAECLDEKTGISFTHLSDSLSILQGVVSALNIEGFNYRIKRLFPLYEIPLGERIVFSAGFTSDNIVKVGRRIVSARHHFYTSDTTSHGDKDEIFVKIIADRVTRDIHGVQVICKKEYIPGLQQILVFIANNLLIDDAILFPSLYIPLMNRIIDPFKATCWGIWRKLLKI